MKEYCIGRPIEGVSLNGNEYLLDDDGEVLRFESTDACLDFIKKNITENEPEDFMWEFNKKEML